MAKNVVTTSPSDILAALKRKMPDPVRAERAARAAGLILMRAIIEMLSHPGTGRVYVRRGKKSKKGRRGKAILHQASAPGQPPAVDTGTLRRSIGMERRGTKLRIGSGVEYAPGLEYGTGRVAPRPFMRPAFTAVKKILGLHIRGDLRRGH